MTGNENTDSCLSFRTRSRVFSCLAPLAHQNTTPKGAVNLRMQVPTKLWTGATVSPRRTTPQ